MFGRIFLLFFLFSEISNAKDSLKTDEELYLKQYLESSNNQYKLAFEPDSNLVLYRTSDNSIMWQSDTKNSGNTTLTMKADGDLFMFGAGFFKTIFGSGKTWSSHTYSKDATFLITDDGKAIIKNKHGVIIWENGVLLDRNRLMAGESLKPGQDLFSPNKEYKLALQNDNRLVVIRIKDQKELLSIATKPGWNQGAPKWLELFMGEDGILTIRRTKPGVEADIWSKDTHKPGAYLILTDEGNLELHDKNGQVLWVNDQWL